MPETAATASTPRAPSSKRLEPLRQVDAGALSIACYEAGPADGPAVMLMHGFPYDIHSYVDVAPQLAAQGCRIAFGMPGGEVLAIVEALEKAGIRFQLVKHENAGGFMAEGYAHRQALEGDAPLVPAILVATLGPGAANAANVVANAHQDRVPMIMLTGRVDPAEAESYTHQVFDHQAFFRPITKASLMASRGAVLASELA